MTSATVGTSRLQSETYPKYRDQFKKLCVGTNPEFNPFSGADIRYQFCKA